MGTRNYKTNGLTYLIETTLVPGEGSWSTVKCGKRNVGWTGVLPSSMVAAATVRAEAIADADALVHATDEQRSAWAAECAVEDAAWDLFDAIYAA